METVCIKFLNETDLARGFFEPAKRSRIGSLPGQVYQVPLTALEIFQETHLEYRRATEDAVRHSHDQVPTGLMRSARTAIRL
jgi:hypothetical protein